jgi:hypothetical protein
MTTITNKFGKTFDFDAVVAVMDDEIREGLTAADVGIEQEFFSAYCAAHAQKFGEEFEFAKQSPQV